MRLFLICDVALNDKDAQNVHIFELFNNLRKVAEVNLFVPKPKKIQLDLSDIKYVPRLNIPPFGLISYQISLFFNLYFYCKKKKVDAFYARQSDFSFMPLILSKYFGIPYFVEVNGLIIDEMMMFKKSKLKLNITRFSEKLGYKHAMKIIAVTRGIKKGLIELYDVPDEKIIVVENGANTDLFRPMDKGDAKKALNLDQKLKYIGFVGNLAPWQGVDYLIYSAPLIISAFPETRFLIVGDGKLRNEWIQLAKKIGVYDKFNFTGSVPYKSVPLYINASDVCVVYKKPIKSGYSPLKLYEYLACGKPVVASRVDGFEIIERQEAGILVKPENPEELAEAIIRLLKDGKLKEKIGMNGREYVIKNHSWEAIGRKIAEVCTRSIE